MAIYSPQLCMPLVQYLIQQMEIAGFTVELDTFWANTPLGRKEFHNISLCMPPPRLYGHAKAHADNNMLKTIELFILLDLIGGPQPNFISLQKPTDKHFGRMADLERRLDRLGLLEQHSAMYLNDGYRGRRPLIEDDHIPFVKRHVPVLHLIPTPFPRTWHTIEDNLESLDWPSIANLHKITTAFVAQYLLLHDF
ncbi:uncharacterized protein MONBRDRAFT_9158 [Monosiga brevicollis MX1]|uniref:Peptidase M28 domain-containing protein n=1 Tax=Monosiga brevicollis TaxID=81824 RepID=A9V297_MONBE|nr:uncharacterized protein MONBRDRAFT_9158 [Monosiga brevicollis MX1]EDQ88338.1 predicted protein [Monosiga brevicollis MX1]|eukprot:XP_001746931.1 hypothetical protein [Monosiga brevicollis MX1]